MSVNSTDLENEANAMLGADAPESKDAETSPPPESSTDNGKVGEDSKAEDSDKSDEVAEKRLKDAQRAYHESREEIARQRKQITELQNEVNEAKTLMAEIDNAVGKDIAEDFPEVGRLQAVIKKQSEQINRLTSQMMQNKSTDVERSEIDAHLSKIRAVHPDFQTLSSNEQFKSWLGAQPTYVQRVAEQGSADEVIDLLSSFKRTPPNTKPQTQSKLEAAKQQSQPHLKSQQSTPQGTRIFTQDEIRNMSMAQYSKMEKEIDAAMADGRVR